MRHQRIHIRGKSLDCKECRIDFNHHSQIFI
jgi:hypothetical protein